MRVEDLARVLSKNDETVAANAIYKLAIDPFPTSLPLPMSLAEELVKAGQVDDVKRYLKAALAQDPYLRLVACYHTGFGDNLVVR